MNTRAILYDFSIYSEHEELKDQETGMARIEGKIEEKLAIAKNMLKMGMDIEQIMKATKLKEEKLQILKEEIKH